MFLKKYSYYNLNYITEKNVKFICYTEISPGIKSYLYNGFKIIKEKNFNVIKNNNNYEAVFMKKN